MRPASILVAWLVVGCAVAHADDRTKMSAALKSLQKARANVQWDPTSEVRADVTCDGIPDAVVLGHRKDEVWVGVVSGASGETPRAISMRLHVGNHSQDSLCQLPVRLETYPIECENENGYLPGCRRIKSCQAFSVIDAR